MTARTYTGTVVAAQYDTPAPNVTLRVTPPLGAPREINLHCGSAVAAQAAGMIGRAVQFQAILSERTECLTSVELCVRSDFGLRAVGEGARTSWIRSAHESKPPAHPASVSIKGPIGDFFGRVAAQVAGGPRR